jgi:Resolvase, N terminal domain
MRVGIYARVSTDTQRARATIGSQLQTLRERVAAEGDELVDEFIDDGYSGARLDRPGLDRMRDAAEAGTIDASAPAAIPAMTEVSFPTGFTPADFTVVVRNPTRAAISPGRPARSASASTGASPA